MLGGLIVCLLLFALITFPQASGHERILDNGDAYLHTWNLWWVSEAVSGFQSPYTTNYNGYPETIDLTFHQLMIPLGVLSWPLFQLGMSSGQVLVFWQWVSLITGYLGMFLLLERINCSLPGTLAGSIYFVLTPLFWQNLPRPDSLVYTLFPWIVLTILTAEHGSRWRWGMPIVLAGVVMLMSPYFGASLMLLWLLSLPLVSRVGVNRWPFFWLAPATLLITSFHWGRQLLGERPPMVDVETIANYSADLSAWVLPPDQLWWIGEQTAWWTEAWTGTEPSLYLGWFALAVVLTGLHQIPRGLRLGAGIISGVFFLLSIGPDLSVLGFTMVDGIMPYGWGLQIIDSLRAFRAPIRFGYVCVFLFTIVLGYVFPDDRWWSWPIVGLIVLELARTPVAVTPLPEQAVLREVRQRVNEPAVVGVPATDWPSEVQYGQTVHEKKLPVIGMSYGTETLWSRVASNRVLNSFYRLEPLPSTGWQELENQGFGGVLLHQMTIGKHHPERLSEWKETLKKRFGPPAIRGERVLFYDFRER